MINLAAIKKWKFPVLSRIKLPPAFYRPESYRQGLMFLLVALIALLTADIFYKTLGIGLLTPKDTRTGTLETAAIRMPVKEPADAYKVILERNLFGSTDKAIGDKLAKAKETPPLSSMLDLRGTVAGEGKYGFAVIAEKGKNKQSLVKIGNQIAGATLLRVMRDQVVFRYMDKEEILKRSGSTEAPVLAGGRKSAPPVAPAPNGPPVQPGVITLSRNELNTSLKDLGQMLSQAQIRPYFNAGVPEGFMISQIRQGSIYQKMGLADGDIIQNIDNRKVQTADDMVSLFNSLRSSPDINLTIKRSGRQEKFNYKIN